MKIIFHYCGSKKQFNFKLITGNTAGYFFLRGVVEFYNHTIIAYIIHQRSVGSNGATFYINKSSLEQQQTQKSNQIPKVLRE